MKSRFSMWSKISGSVTRAANTALSTILVDESGNIFLKDVGVFRLGLPFKVNGTIVAAAYHIEPLMKAAEADIEVEERVATIKTKTVRGGTKTYSFDFQDPASSGLKSYTIKRQIPKTSVEIDSSVVEDLKDLVPHSPSAGSKLTDIYCGMYKSGRKTLFASGSYSHAYIKEMKNFPVVPVSFVGSPFLRIVEDSDKVILFEKDARQFFYVSSEEENYEAIIPFEPVRIQPDAVMKVYDITGTTQPSAEIMVNLEEFSSGISEVVKDAKKEAGGDDVRIIVEDNLLKISSRGYGVSSAVEMLCMCDKTVDITVKNPVAKDLPRLFGRLKPEEDLTAIHIVENYESGSLQVMRIPGTITYMCTLNQVQVEK